MIWKLQIGLGFKMHPISHVKASTLHKIWTKTISVLVTNESKL